MVLADGPSIGAAELELEGLVAKPASATTSLREAKEVLERELVAKALEEHKGNISKAARALGISRPTLYELMARYGL